MRIVINTRDAEIDTDHLREGRNDLQDARRNLVSLRNDIQASWQGQGAIQCVELINGFISQIDTQLGRVGNAMIMLRNISNTYREADIAASGLM